MRTNTNNISEKNRFQHYLNRLSDNLIHSHVAQTQSLWGSDTDQNLRAKLLLERIRRFGPEGIFLSGIVDDSGALCASLKRYHFEILMGGRPVKCVGIGAVYTDVGHRRLGMAERLLHTVLTESYEQYGCGAALLYSDIEPRYYERFGFHSLPSKSWRISVHDIAEAQPLSLRTATEVDFEWIQHSRAEAEKTYNLTIKHSPETWTLLRAVNAVERDLVLSENGINVGFVTVNLNSKEHYLWINECFLLPAMAARFWATLKAEVMQRGIMEIRGWHNALELQPTGATVHNRIQAVPMLAILGPSGHHTPSLEDHVFWSTDHF